MKLKTGKLNYLRCATALLAAAAVLATATAARAELYAVIDLGLMTGSEAAVGDINSSGQIVASGETNGAYAAMVYGGAWTNLGTLGGIGSYGSAVNDSLRIVGDSRNAAGLTRAFLWTPGGTDGVPGNPEMKDLGTLGGSASEAYAINGSGQIAGYAQTSQNDRAFRYSGGTMTDIGALLGNQLPNSYAYGINDAGHVAGTALDPQWNWNSLVAFFYNGATAVNIGRLPGGQYASALALNNADLVVGYSSITGGFVHALRYAGGVMNDLGTLGGNYSYANAVNNHDVIVGVSGIDPGNDSVNRAFIYIGGSMVDLNTLLDASGAGWTLVEASDINDAGQIVGFGIYDGVQHGFLLNPVLKITEIQVQGTNVMLSFTTQHTALYAIDSRESLTTGSWNAVMTGIAGTGGIVTATNFGAATVPALFYHVRLLPAP